MKMTQTLDLNKMGLVTLSKEEVQKVDGGSFPIVSFIRDYILGKVIDATYEEWHRQVERDKRQPNTTYNWNGSVTWR